MDYRDQPDFLTDDDSEPDEIWLLFSISARKLVDSADRHAFLNWIANAGPSLAPGMAAQIDPRTGPVGHAFRAIGMEIYRAMPLPQNDFRRPDLPKPGRNERCPCGSGRKYKQCCQTLEGLLDLREYNLLPFVLDALPRKQLTELPDSAVDIDMVADTARHWLEDNDADRAAKLLSPWFAEERKLTGKLELLFDRLMDCYLELGNPRKRKRLLANVLESGDRVLRVAALHRRASIESDQGDHAAAWASVEEARRLDPDNPALAPLEITLHLSEGNKARAQDRARFWSARLRRTGNPDFVNLIEFLDAVTADPDAAMTSMARGIDPDLDTLAELLAAAPTVAAHYSLEEGDETYLVPDRRVVAVERTWLQVFPQIKPQLTATQHFNESVWNSAPDWLPVLESSPYAWQSFDILDDLIMAVDAMPVMGLDTSLLPPLLERGVALLETNLAASDARDITLPWGFQQNRPALRILAHRAFLMLERQANEPGSLGIIKSAERLLALNPDDNHGLREPLTRAYLACGAPAKALEICERYPDDFCGMTLNRILALYRLGRLDEAREVLRAAAERFDVAIKMLLAKNPRQPKLSEFGIRYGGKDEAWLYREAHLKLWQQDGALDWLRQARKTL